MSDRMSVTEAREWLPMAESHDVNANISRLLRTAIFQAEQIDRIRRAVTDHGNHPDYHRRQVERLRTEWPTLYHAIMDMITDRGSPPPLKYPPYDDRGLFQSIPSTFTTDP